MYKLKATIGAAILFGCSSVSDSISSMNQDNNPLPPCPESPNCTRIAVEFSADSTTLINAISDAMDLMGVHSKELNEANRIDAVYRIPVFGWKDDVAVLVQSDENSTITYIRSASREGEWDLGVNKRRVKKLIRLTNKQLSK